MEQWSTTEFFTFIGLLVFVLLYGLLLWFTDMNIDRLKRKIDMIEVEVKRIISDLTTIIKRGEK